VINVKRNRVPRPDYFESQEVRGAYAAAAHFFSHQAKVRAQQEFHFYPVLPEGSVLMDLFDVFGQKCAFCESPAPVVVGRFRPSDGAADLLGNLSREHYWWLAYEWENLYPICKSCIRAKGPRFPVEGRRAPAKTPYARVVEVEHPLLLDPCHDDPSKHLVFSRNGRVSSDTERGRTTIEVFALNRESLVKARAKAMREDIPWHRTLPYAAARRQVARQAAKQIHEDFEVYEAGLESISLEAAAPAQPHYFIKSRMVERIELENFRLFRKLELPCSSAAETAPWLMLLGENGLGKSTLLQAVALALMGDKLRNRFRFRRREFLSHGARNGAVRIFMTGVREPIELKITTTGFKASAPPKTLLLAYGATRLFGERGIRARGAVDRYARTQNLFSPLSQLTNPTTFFRTTRAAQHDAAARVAKSLLSLGDDARIVRASGNRMQIVRNGARDSFDDLSDGYRSMLALASDIMAVMFDQWTDMKAAEGIVLIDELENHLHPTWKMRVVSSLRTVFPRVQFITTTHDPLCLRGLQNGEVAVLQRAANGSVFARTDDLPPVAGLRVDQLLTSEHFGLASTIDPMTEELFRQYYALLAKPKLNAEEQRERERLKEQLASITVLGSTRRDQLALEAIDEFLAQERQMPDAGQRLTLRDATKRRVAELWRGNRPTTP
jgi:predicted ATPase